MREIKRKYNTKPNKTSFKNGHKPIPGAFGKGNKLSKSARKKISKSLTGKTGSKARNWRGGKTELRKLIGSLKKYKIWRIKVFTRDNWTCQGCGLRGVYLEAHHIVSIKKIIKKYEIKDSDGILANKFIWNVSNGVTLCKECHKLTDTYGGKNA